jgi:hypothetical protein
MAKRKSVLEKFSVDHELTITQDPTTNIRFGKAAIIFDLSEDVRDGTIEFTNAAAKRKCLNEIKERKLLRLEISADRSEELSEACGFYFPCHPEVGDLDSYAWPRMLRAVGIEYIEGGVDKGGMHDVVTFEFSAEDPIAVEMVIALAKGKPLE